VTWDYIKGGDLGKRISFLDIILGSKNGCRYFVTETIDSLLIYQKFYFVVLNSFPQNMGFCYNFE
jgi:hypothetical protein